MKRYVTILLSVMTLIGCEEVITVELPGQADLIVIEGWIHDQGAPQTIEITRTTGFSSEQPVPRVRQARVIVSDHLGNRFYFDEIQPGTYRSDGLDPTYGHTYQLQVILANGDSIVSAFEKMREVATIDSLGYDYFLTEDPEDPKEEVRVYFPVIEATDPGDEMNFYLWNIYRNDTLFSDPEQIFLLEDRFINGSSYKNEFTSYNFGLFDEIRVEVQGISRSTFDFFTLFKSQLVLAGTSAGGRPAALIGNLVNVTNPDKQVLGFFAATSIKSRDVRITP